MPITERISPMKSERTATPLSVISIPVNGCGTCPRPAPVGAERVTERARYLPQEADAEILLEESDPLVHPRLEPLARLDPVGQVAGARMRTLSGRGLGG